MAMKDGFNLKSLFPRYNETYFLQYNYIGDIIILSVFIVLFCIVGLVGNGYTVWLLGFRIQRKPFAIYVLNLAVADFGFLVLLLPLYICFLPTSFEEHLDFPVIVAQLFMSLFVSMYTSRQLLLTAISIDRWVSVLFPNWYKCHRSPVLSTSVCAFIWVLSFAGIGVPLFLVFMEFIPYIYRSVLFGSYATSTLICLVFVILSTLTMFVKIGLRSQRCQRGTLSNVILLMLLSFILFTILTNVCFYMVHFIPPAYFVFCNALKGSINPLIYFSAGRQDGGKYQERMKVVLQRVFKEERDTRMELQPRAQKEF